MSEVVDRGATHIHGDTLGIPRDERVLFTALGISQL
jgi:hypothetical protein